MEVVHSAKNFTYEPKIKTLRSTAAKLGSELMGPLTLADGSVATGFVMDSVITGNKAWYLLAMEEADQLTFEPTPNTLKNFEFLRGVKVVINLEVNLLLATVLNSAGLIATTQLAVVETDSAGRIVTTEILSGVTRCLYYLDATKAYPIMMLAFSPLFNLGPRVAKSIELAANCVNTRILEQEEFDLATQRMGLNF